MRIYRNYRDNTERKDLLSPILISIILHILLGLLFLNRDMFLQDKSIAEKDKKDYIEISEIPVREDQETEPPEKPSVLAEKSRKAEEEKTIDDTTRITKRGPVQDELKPTQPEPEKPTAEKPEPSAETSKQPEKEKQKEEETRKEVVREEPPKDKQPLKTTEKETEQLSKEQERESSTNREKKDLSEIGRKLLQSAPSQPSAPDAPDSDKDPMLGADVPKKEDTVDLSTREFKYVSYFTNLKRKIEGVWNYPEESQMRGETGRLFLTFTLNREGDLEEIKLLDSSGYTRLDDEAIRAIRVASPFNPFPESWELERLNIRASFEYRYRRFIR